MNELISSRATLLESSREHVASLQRVCELSNERCDRSKLTEPRRAYELTSAHELSNTKRSPVVLYEAELAPFRF